MNSEKSFLKSSIDIQILYDIFLVFVMCKICLSWVCLFCLGFVCLGDKYKLRNTDRKRQIQRTIIFRSLFINSIDRQTLDICLVFVMCKIYQVQQLLCLSFDMTEVCKNQRLLCLGFIKSSLCNVQSLLFLSFIMSRDFCVQVFYLQRDCYVQRL